MPNRLKLSSNVIALSIVSFFNDVSSEMIYPLLPLFITGVLGAGASAVGAVEGVADAVLSLSNVLFGLFSDRIGRRKPFIFTGYFVANVARPFIGITSQWWQVLGLRSMDRLGKGIRTPPRDSLIAVSVSPERGGRAFGFQRGMDNAGALLGPMLASLFLLYWHNLRVLFLLAAVPGVMAVLVVFFFVKEVAPGKDHAPLTFSRPFQRASSGKKALGRGVLLYLGALALFSLGNSSDAFLMLRARELGFGIATVPLLWMILHVSRALSAFPGGILADRWGRKRMLLWGWVIYGGVYFALALVASSTLYWFLLLVYGLYYGLTEGAERALLSELVAPGALGNGFGWFHGVRGVALLAGNLLFGYLWQIYGAPVAFAEGTLCAILAVLLLLKVGRNKT